MIQNKIKINNIRNNFITLLAFVLPLNKSIVPFIIIINLVIWIIEAIRFQKLKTFQWLGFVFAISLYLWHLLGMSYTENIKSGLFDLEQKMSLLIFPILFLAYPQSEIESMRAICKNFIWGCFLAACICFANASYKYHNYNDWDVFYYGQFSVIMHTSYFSMYLCAAVIFLLFQEKIISNRFTRYILTLFFTLCIVLISSKSGIIALVFTGFYKIFYELFIFNRLNKTIIMASIILSLFAGFIKFFPKSAIRIKSMKKDLFESGHEINTTASRIVIWKHAIKLIKHNFMFGVGTGDVKDELKLTYVRQGELKLAEKQLNAHNQYLQTFIALGFIGFLLLIVSIGIIALQAYKNGCIDGFLFTLLVAFNFLFESMLETQAGVVFVAFFLSLYFRQSKQRSRNMAHNFAS